MMDLLGITPADQVRDSWQGRCISAATGALYQVLLVSLFMEYGPAVPIWLRAIDPTFTDIREPFLCSYALIDSAGAVHANQVRTQNGLTIITKEKIYESEADLVKDFRDLADKLKLSDKDRRELTVVLRKWIVADHRINYMGTDA